MASKNSENFQLDQFESDLELTSNSKKLQNLHTEVEIKLDPERIIESSLIYKCSACLDLFKTADALKEHKLNHKTDFLCDICQKAFRYFHLLVQHEKRHRSHKKKIRGKKKLPTPIKQKAMPQNESLTAKPINMTLISKTTIERTHCKLCAESYEDHQKLQSRGIKIVGNRYPILVLRFTPAGSPKYKCCICNDQIGSFKDLSELIRHQRSHIRTKSCDFECNVCGKYFTQGGSLARHTLYHTGERRYGCNLCELKFVQPSDLQKHLRTHTGERPYLCEICGKGFKVREHVKLHYMRVHSSDCFFDCGQCSSAFKTSQDLHCHKKREHLVANYKGL